jgi:uncharacterized membrane protein (DUF373 family)
MAKVTIFHKLSVASCVTSDINYIKVIIEIAIIAVVRHILIMDFEHINGNTLLGVSSLIFVLGFLYFILNKKIKLGKNEE